MNGGSTRTSVWCAMLRHAETPKGPRGAPTCLTTGSKTARCTAPRVGFSVCALASRIEAAHVPSPAPLRRPLSSHLRTHGDTWTHHGPAGDLAPGKKE